MNKKIKKIASIFKYKKPQNYKEFYIPEINEGLDDIVDEIADDKPSGNKKPLENKVVKKPIPVSELKSEKDKKADDMESKVISRDIQPNIMFIRQSFNAKNNNDIIVREFNVSGEHKAFIAYIEGMADRNIINNSILRPLLKKNHNDISEGCNLDYILKNVIETDQVSIIREPEDVIYEILIGNTCLYVEDCDFYISSETKGYDKRSVEKPQTEGIVRGAQEGFNENLRTNITLIRRIIKNKDLSTEYVKVGERNKNLCAIMYIRGLTNPFIINEVKRRIESLKTDFIAGSGMLEQFIEENPWSLVPTILSTERPDRAASHIVEGKVVIISEGTPFALIVPVSIATMFHTPEDSSLRWQYGTMLRGIRLIAAFIATFTPGLYVALTNFHREMIPTDLLIAIAKAREDVPFPTLIEVFLMELSFELIREAGIRVPGIIGNTIGIVGALILGQAAVQASLVSPVLIIVVAITGLGNFAIPDFSMGFASRIIKVIFIILGAALGFYGISLGFVALLAILANTKSFGVPLLSFIAPRVKGTNDLIIKRPSWKQEYRPDNINSLDPVRQPKVSRKWTLEDSNVPKRKNTEEEEDMDEQ